MATSRSTPRASFLHLRLVADAAVDGGDALAGEAGARPADLFDLTGELAGGRDHQGADGMVGSIVSDLHGMVMLVGVKPGRSSAGAAPAARAQAVARGPIARGAAVGVGGGAVADGRRGAIGGHGGGCAGGSGLPGGLSAVGRPLTDGPLGAAQVRATHICATLFRGALFGEALPRQLQRRQDEGRRLAGARLGAAEDVTSLQRHGYGLFLDGGRLGVAECLDSLEVA